MQAVPSAPTVDASVSPPTEAGGGASALVFTDVYRDHFRFVWRVAQGLGAPAATLDDVVQEVFLVVHARLAEFRGPLGLKTWLSRIAVNVVRHHRRTRARKSPHELGGHEPNDPDTLASRGRTPHEEAEQAERARFVQRLLDSLDDEKREVIVLADIEELTIPEIAQAIGVKPSTVYSRLRLARQAFDQALARHRAANSRSERWTA